MVSAEIRFSTETFGSRLGAVDVSCGTTIVVEPDLMAYSRDAPERPKLQMGGSANVPFAPSTDAQRPLE
jgi:hypothetical protein